MTEPRTQAGRDLFTDQYPMDMMESDGVTPDDIAKVEAEAIKPYREALASAYEAMNEALRWAANETAGVKTMADAERHMAGYDALIVATVKAGEFLGVLHPLAEDSDAT